LNIYSDNDHLYVYCKEKTFKNEKKKGFRVAQKGAETSKALLNLLYA